MKIRILDKKLCRRYFGVMKRDKKSEKDKPVYCFFFFVLCVEKMNIIYKIKYIAIRFNCYGHVVYKIMHFVHVIYYVNVFQI
jgi:hypothetical protein